MKIKIVFLIVGLILSLNTLVSAQTPLTVVATASPSVICEGNQTMLQALPSGGTGIYTYSWASNPSGMPSTPQVTTAYTVTVTSGSETASASVTVFVNHVPGTAGNISGPTSVCTGSTNNIYSIPLITDATAYTWTVPYGTTITSCGTNEMLLNVSSVATSGLISVSGVNACGAGLSSSIGVIVNQSPIADAGIDQIIPSGGIVTLNGSVSGGSGSLSYAWSPALLLQNASVQNPTTIPLPASAVFTLEVTDNITGCVSSSIVHIIVAGGPLQVTANATPQTICEGSTIQLNALPQGGTGVYTYIWSSNPMGFTSALKNPVISPTTTETYTVIVDDGNWMTSASVTVQVIQIPDSLGAITGLTNVCRGTTHVVYTVPSTPAITNYFWSLPLGATLVSGQNTPGIVVNYGSNAVSGNITVVGSSVCGCTTETLPIALHSPPNVNAGGDQTINCGGAGVTIGTTAVGGMAYSWSPSYALSNSNIAQPTATPWENTTYTLTVTDLATGCYATDSVAINVIGAPVADAGINQTINCGGPGVVIGTPTIVGIGYNWSPSNGLSNANIAQPTATPLLTTVYILTVTDLSTGCLATDDVTVTVNVGPTADAGVDQNVNCINTGVVIGTPSVTGLDYSWSPANGLSNANIAQPTASPLSTTDYILTVTDAGTGCYATDDVTVTVSIEPTADAGANQTISSGTTITLNGSATGGSGNYSYSWSPANLLQNANILNPTTLTLTGSTIFTLVVTDNITGCTGSANVQITVIITDIEDVSPFTINLYPNPTNGKVTLEMSNYPNEPLTMKVYNILGEMIFNALLGNERKQSFDFRTFTNGLYYVKISGNKINKIEKLIIQKID